MTNAADYWFRCPSCGELGGIDAEQADGKVSIVCACGFHETGQIRPLVPTTTPMRPEDAPTWVKP